MPLSGLNTWGRFFFTWLINKVHSRSLHFAYSGSSARLWRSMGSVSRSNSDRLLADSRCKLVFPVFHHTEICMKAVPIENSFILSFSADPLQQVFSAFLLRRQGVPMASTVGNTSASVITRSIRLLWTIPRPAGGTMMNGTWAEPSKTDSFGTCNGLPAFLRDPR